MNETTYQDALRRIQTLWNAGAGEIAHPDHPEFHELYEQVTAYEAEQGLAVPQPTFQIDSLERLEWYVGKKADLKSQKQRLKAQYEAMLKDLERDEERLDWRFAAQAEGVLRQELGEKKRSLKFLSGTAGLRKVAARVSVSDERALVAAIKAQGGSLETAVVEQINARILNQLVKVEDGQAVLPEDGLIVELPGLSIKPAGETFYVKAGKEE